MLLAQFNEIVFANERLATGIDVYMSSKLFALLNDRVNLVKS